MAPTKSLFRLLIIVAISCGAFSIALSALSQSYLPPELQQYLYFSSLQTGERELALVSLFIPLLVLTIVAAIGLYRFRPWARILALAITIGWLILSPLVGIIVESGWVALFSDLSTLSWGTLLAMAFWSPVSEAFMTKTATP